MVQDMPLLAETLGWVSKPSKSEHAPKPLTSQGHPCPLVKDSTFSWTKRISSDLAQLWNEHSILFAVWKPASTIDHRDYRKFVMSV
jgi:hypothetical protein